MGRNFKWFSSWNADFNFDYYLLFIAEEVAKKEGKYNFVTQDPDSSEREGVGVFYNDHTDDVFHIYSSYACGIDILNVAYHYLDLVLKGQDEAGREFIQFWMRRHDEYSKCCGQSLAVARSTCTTTAYIFKLRVLLTD
jgi:predicted dithiol-disulfide oxidoreductase (DUF899 family)